jgi:hypothetical protein
MKTKKVPASCFSVGSSVLIRTVSNYFTGRITSIDKLFVVLEDAAWIASTGRFCAALNSGVLDEIEPYPDPVNVAIGAIVDITKWRHALPRDVK